MKIDKIYKAYELNNFNEGYFYIYSENNAHKHICAIRVNVINIVKWEEDGLYIDDEYVNIRVNEIIKNNIKTDISSKDYNDSDEKYIVYMFGNNVYGFSNNVSNYLYIDFIDYKEWVIKGLLE